MCAVISFPKPPRGSNSFPFKHAWHQALTQRTSQDPNQLARVVDMIRGYNIVVAISEGVENRRHKLRVSRREAVNTRFAAMGGGYLPALGRARQLSEPFLPASTNDASYLEHLVHRQHVRAPTHQLSCVVLSGPTCQPGSFKPALNTAGSGLDATQHQGIHP